MTLEDVEEARLLAPKLSAAEYEECRTWWVFLKLGGPSPSWHWEPMYGDDPQMDEDNRETVEEPQ